MNPPKKISIQNNYTTISLFVKRYCIIGVGDTMFKTEDNVKHIYAEDILRSKNIKANQIIDIREPLELKAMSLDGTLHIPMLTLLNHPEKFLSKDMRYYILCRSGHRSYDVTEILSKKGYDLVNIVGGILVIDEIQARET